jgi:hypothetical protein
MKNRYGILLGMVIVIGLFAIVNSIFWYSSSAITNSFVLILLFGGFIATFTSKSGKARVGLISGLGVSIVLIIYSVLNNKTVPVSSVDLISYLIIPGFMMCIGGFVAKLMKG